MDDLSFTTFVKLALMPTTQGKFGALQRMMNSDRGYDFYKQMKFAAKGVARGEVEASEIIAKLSTIKNPVERDHNVRMATHFLEWWKEQSGALALKERPSGYYKADGMLFGIRLQPELAYVQNEKINVIYLWATKNPAITKQAAAAGLQMLKGRLGKGSFSGARFSILNLRNKTLLSDDLISNQSEALFNADVAGINELWKSFM